MGVAMGVAMGTDTNLARASALLGREVDVDGDRDVALADATHLEGLTLIARVIEHVARRQLDELRCLEEGGQPVEPLGALRGPLPRKALDELSDHLPLGFPRCFARRLGCR